MIASVSVIIPHYNALETIGRTLSSVVCQTLSVAEIIIVDDCSADKNLLSELVSEFTCLVPIKIIFLDTNQGAAHARNVALKLASSKYVAFLDSDDVWHPRKIELQYKVMEREDIFLSGHGYVFDLSRTDYGDLNFEYRSVVKRHFLKGNPFFTPTVMVRRDKFVSFDEEFRRVDDYKCWFENLHNGKFIIFNTKLAAGFKSPIGASGLSGSTRLMHLGYVSVLKKLYVENRMNFFDFLIANAFECVKYPLRVLLISLGIK